MILGATVVSGAAGYLVTWLVAIRAEPADYAWFATLWSALFLAVGSLGGLQQEVTRAAGHHDSSEGSALPRFVAGAAAVAALVLAAASPLWAPLLAGDPALVAILVVGCAAYCLVAGVSGALYGALAWAPISALIAVDGLLRLVGVVVVLAVAGPDARLALAVALVAPFPLALVLVTPFAAARLRGLRADVPTPRLARQAAGAVAAAAGSAVLISGFPALAAAAAGDLSARLLAPLLLALMLTRAPIVIPAMALQSLLVVLFRDTGRLRPVVLTVGIVVGVAAALSALAALIGPPLILAVFGPAYAIEPAVVGALVASSGLIAAIIVAGAGLLAASRHGAYVGGWLVAAGVTVAVLLAPGEPLARILAAAIAGPLAALAVDVAALLMRRRSAP